MLLKLLCQLRQYAGEKIIAAARTIGERRCIVQVNIKKKGRLKMRNKVLMLLSIVSAINLVLGIYHKDVINLLVAIYFVLQGIMIVLAGKGLEVKIISSVEAEETVEERRVYKK